MIRRPPRSTLDRSSAASDVYKRQLLVTLLGLRRLWLFIAVLYGLCTILVARLPSGDRSQERPLRAILRESTDGLRATLYREFWLPVREGWSFMANHPPVRAATINPVSYTHLTLPTSDLV